MTFEKPDAPPDRNFELKELFLDAASFPESLGLSDVNGPSEACEASPLGSGCRSHDAQRTYYSFAGGSASIEIHQYTSEKKASSDYRRILEHEFYVSEFDSEWIVPDKFPFHSDYADDLFFACHTSGYASECRYHARYDEFNLTLNFVASMDMEHLVYDDLEELLRLVDARMHLYMGK